MYDLADAAATRRLGEPHGADDVDAGVELRVVHRVADVDLRGQVEHHLGPGLAERAPIRSASTMSALTNSKSACCWALSRFELRPGAEVVDADDGMPVCEQAVYQR